MQIYSKIKEIEMEKLNTELREVMIKVFVHHIIPLDGS
jgi:hypothetical protein